ncbi:hypothetical protein BDC45DRAFT_553620 [Circinella umbellata]|nr:hypothetical protein BDC45DRAFT_553620 [Circinella umbellata]
MGFNYLAINQQLDNKLQQSTTWHYIKQRANESGDIAGNGDTSIKVHKVDGNFNFLNAQARSVHLPHLTLILNASMANESNSRSIDYSLSTYLWDNSMGVLLATNVTDLSEIDQEKIIMSKYYRVIRACLSKLKLNFQLFTKRLFNFFILIWATSPFLITEVAID